VSDQDGSPLAWLQNAWNVNYTQYSQELRFSGQLTDQIQFTAGGFYFKSKADQNARVSLDGAANEAATFDFLEFDPVRTTSKSVFAHVEYNPVEPLTLTAGVRYTKDTKFFQYGRALAPGYPGTFLDMSITPINGLNGTYKGDRVDYRFTADYRFTRDVSVYVQTATGYKGGGINPRPYYALQVQPFDPETVTAYEVGLKSFLFDRKVRLNVAGYLNKYKGIQLTLNQCPKFVPPGLPQQCAMNANVGDADIKGFEVESEIHPIDNALIDFSASYVDFQYKSLDSATGIKLSDKPPYVPKWKFNVGAQYRFQVGDRGSLTPRFDVAYIGQQQANTINYAETVIPSYTLVNARLTWDNAEGDWSVALEATNLFDKYYAITRQYSMPPVTGAFNYAGIQPGPPRRVAVTIRKSF
jgi:iron complex outermembrane receptor protein